MPTPRLVSCSHVPASGAVMSASDMHPGNVSTPCHVSGELLDDKGPVQQQPAHATDHVSSSVLRSVSSSVVEDAVTTGHPDELLADSIEEEGLQEAAQQDAGPAILVTNELFRQLPDEGIAAQQSDWWQANDIFETQANIAEISNAGRALSAPSDQYSSLVISSSSSRSGHSSHWLTESAQFTQSGALEHAEKYDIADNVDESSPVLPGSVFKQHSNQQQQQVFNELFDTQLSQILTTQDDMSGSSSELPTPDIPDAVSAHCYTVGPVQRAKLAVSPSSSQVSDADPSSEPAHVCCSMTGSASDSILVSMHSTASSEACIACASPSTQIEGHLCLPTPAADTAAADIAAGIPTRPIETPAAPPPSIKHQEAMKREPLTAAVSTAQLEVMGWDMFADTLGTFRLLSDTDSDAESTANLLPEPSELSPITPEAAEPQLKLNHEEDVPAMTFTTGISACLDDCHSQGQAQFQLIDSSLLVLPADKYVIDDYVSCLEREYQTMMADRQGLVEAYPGMSSDAEEFDSDGTGCLGHASCAGRVEQCVTCNPCATCACYPYAALRPGKHHQKSKLKRVWARLRRTGAACVHPNFPHERYN